MTRQSLSYVWARRGDAWDKLGGVTLALLEAMRETGDATLRERLQSALGCIHGAQELIALATERLHVLASASALDTSLASLSKPGDPAP